jgi:hypothetical protein
MISDSVPCGKLNTIYGLKEQRKEAPFTPVILAIAHAFIDAACNDIDYLLCGELT